MSKHCIMLFLPQPVVTGTYCMRPYLSGIAGRLLGTMSSDHLPGTFSMAFVTVPNEETAKKLAQ